MPIMSLLACISPLVSCVCQPLVDAVQESLRTAAQDFLSWLRGEVNSRISSRRGAAVEVPVLSASVLVAEDTLSEIRNHLDDDSVGIVGIYGMGGVGKTTLLRQINNDFFQSGTGGKFDAVIWATVSRVANIEKIQKQIGDRLGLSFYEGESSASSSLVEGQADLLFQTLSKKQFLLLLDDVWAKLALTKIGIPQPKGRRNCKIVFTTRSLNVCRDMDADEDVKVKLLDDRQSWELFCSKLRTNIILREPYIRALAEQVVGKCGRLPLALITVGKAMANKTLPIEWQDAIKDLDHSAERLRGMDEVLSCLKLSYDYLENDKMRSALLYCAMYPEDTDIRREEVIEYWVGEGLLDADVDGHIDDARRRGRDVISNLLDASLLEAGIQDAELTVRMHDAVRDMALWLNSHEYVKVDAFLVLTSENMTQQVERGNHVRRIWMRGLDWELSPCVPACPNTWSLLLNRTRSFSEVRLQSFCNFMRTLRVLDLSHTWSLNELPVEIGLLVELRYLNLSRTWIKSLPKELSSLTKLKQLLLESTSGLGSIPREAVAGLSNLQVLNMMSAYNWDTRVTGEAEECQQETIMDVDAVDGGCRPLELSDLGGLHRLQELHLALKTSRALKVICHSDKLCKSVTHLTQTIGCDEFWRGEDGTLLPTALERIGGHLRYLCLWDGPTHWVGELRINLGHLPCLEELELTAFHEEMTVVLVGADAKGNSSDGAVASSSVPSFRRLRLSYCSGLKELKLTGRFLCLEEIHLRRCGEMKELVMDGDFPTLKRLFFLRLWSLWSIRPRPLLLPLLETVQVISCRQLRSLPLGPSSAPNLRKIVGAQEWWDDLEWPVGDGSNIKSMFAPCFEPVY